MQKNVAVQFNNVTIKTADDIKLNQLTFNVFYGDFVYLYGQTGSGKKGLLQTLYAALPILQGQATVLGYELNALHAEEIPLFRRNLGIISHQIPLSSFMTVAENLQVVLTATDWQDPKQQQLRINKVLQLLKILHHKKTATHLLSQKDYAKVLVARALLNHPPLIIADNPIQNLDRQSSHEVMAFLHRYARDNKSTVICATTDERLPSAFPADDLFICQNNTVQPLETMTV